MRNSPGFSFIDTLAAIAIMAIVAGAAIPLAHANVDRSRAFAAARYVAARLAAARFEAVKRSAFVAIQFAPQVDGFWMRPYVDRNGDGVTSRDISVGVDVPIGPAERLDFNFPGTSFGIVANVVAIDPGQPLNVSDPVQIGSSALMSFNPNGSSTGGTLFIRGRGNHQFAVRVLGATARTRIYEFNFGDRAWHMY